MVEALGKHEHSLHQVDHLNSAHTEAKDSHPTHSYKLTQLRAAPHPHQKTDLKNSQEVGTKAV